MAEDDYIQLDIYWLYVREVGNARASSYFFLTLLLSLIFEGILNASMS